MASGNLTTLEKLEAWLQLSPGDPTEDMMVDLIADVSDFIEAECNRAFLSTAYSENWDGTGARAMSFPQYPVSAVSSLSIDGEVIPAAVIAPGVTPYGYIFTATRLSLVGGPRFTRSIGNIAISYTAGFLTVPPALDRACLELCAFILAEQSRTGMSSKSMAGETTSYVIRDMPPRVASTLANFKRVVPA